jgi:hypothetical protein
MLPWGLLSGVALASANEDAPPPAQELRPGMALTPDQLPPEASHYEALLQGEPLSQDGDTVEKRRRFDDQALRIGIGMGVAVGSFGLALYTEVDAGDRLALGSEVGLSLWGLMAGGYLRVRPAVWGGRQRRALHALTLQGGYRYMQYGEDPFSGILASACHGDCDRVHFLNAPAHFITLEAGFEHAFASGWGIRYSMGAALMAGEPDWRCEKVRQPISCADGSAPDRQLLVTRFVLSHAIF